MMKMWHATPLDRAEPKLPGLPGLPLVGLHRASIRLCTVLAGLTLSLSCGGGDAPTAPQPEPARPTTVTVSPSTAELAAVGATVQLSAEVRDQNGQVMAGATVTWASADNSVAGVNSSGLVTAAANGTATITATAGSASGTAMVTVTQMVGAVTLTPPADTLFAGDTLRLVAEAADANGHLVAGVAFEWASSDTAVAVVDSLGLVTAVMAGDVTVTATSSGVSGSAELTVAARVPTTVAVTPDALAFTAVGQTAQLSAEVRDQAGRVMADAAVAWSSGDTAVAVVDSLGLVTAVGPGVTAVAGTAGAATDEAVVTVTQSAGSVVVSPAADTIAAGDTLRLAAAAFDENGNRVGVAVFDWSSSDPSVAAVDASGLVRGVRAGSATITATADNVQGTSEITVANPDRAALVALYNATDGPNWVDNTNWLTDKPLGEWYGVRTNATGRVVLLQLAGKWDSELRRTIPHGLTGPIPPELGNLTNLNTLRLHSNDLTGPIPPELGNLTNLNTLWLYANGLTGSIPSELGNLASLQLLRLFNNGLTGSIPSELGNLANLRQLDLGANALTGPVPSELGNLANLEKLGLGANGLTGSIPSELGNLADLRQLDLGANALTGPVPSELGNLANLQQLGLGANGLTGPIPSELGNLTNLERLYLDRNALTGSIPISFLQLDRLTTFSIGGNESLCIPGTALFAAFLQRIQYRDTEPVNCNADDVAALTSLYEAAGGDGWTASDGWLGDFALADWHGIRADSLGRVRALDLSNNGLKGRLPGALGQFVPADRVADVGQPRPIGPRAAPAHRPFARCIPIRGDRSVCPRRGIVQPVAQRDRIPRGHRCRMSPADGP